MSLDDQNELHTVDATVALRRPYLTPKLSALGSFAKLTRDAAKSNYTDMAAMDAMSDML